jgi:uncharacterized membrane protein YhhN
MTTIFLILFTIDVVFHLSAIVVRWEWPRRISKALLAPLLLGYYTAGAEHFLFTVFLAGTLSWLGDIFLIRTNKIILFNLGLLSFLLGHLCYIRSLLYFTGNINLVALIITLAAAILLGFAAFRFIRPEKADVLPFVVYGTVLLGTVISSCCLLFSHADLRGAAAFIGSLCFLVSDTILGYGHFRKRDRIYNLPVMLTYIAAQTCLILNLAHL